VKQRSNVLSYQQIMHCNKNMKIQLVLVDIKKIISNSCSGFLIGMELFNLLQR
jgi:hypothetical protein